MGKNTTTRDEGTMIHKQYIGIDNYNGLYALNKPIKKTLLRNTGYTTAKPMYIDTKDGIQKHIGYVLTQKGTSPLWVTIYKLKEWVK